MLSVVCPIYNEEKYIALFLDSLLRQDYPKDDLEILLVDGMSTDRTREIVCEYANRYSFIRLIDNPKRIVPTAMNIGIRQSNGEIIIRLDAHAIYPDNYFSVLSCALKELNADNVGGICRTLPVHDTPICRAIAAVLSSSFGVGNSYFRIGTGKRMEVDTVPFGCFHRSIFNQIGYFDEELVRNQDDEFNGRIIKNGGKIYLLPDVVIDYYARDSIRKTGRMFYQYGLFKPLVNKKLGNPATMRQFFPLCFVAGLIVGPLFGFISIYFWFAYFAVLLLYFVIATGFSIRHSHDIRQILIQNYVYLVVHLNYGWGYIIGLFKVLTKHSFSVVSNR